MTEPHFTIEDYRELPHNPDISDYRMRFYDGDGDGKAEVVSAEIREYRENVSIIHISSNPLGKGHGTKALNALKKLAKEKGKYLTAVDAFMGYGFFTRNGFVYSDGNGMDVTLVWPPDFNQATRTP